MNTRFFISLCMSRRFACSFLCAFGDILDCYTLPSIGSIVVTGIWDLNDTYEFIVDHNALGTILTGAFRFVNIDVIDQFSE